MFFMDKRGSFSSFLKNIPKTLYPMSISEKYNEVLAGALTNEGRIYVPPGSYLPPEVDFSAVSKYERKDDPLEKYLKDIKSDISYGVERKVLLKTLNFDFVQLLAKHGAFIAGGAITSIFCERPINDIDIFFRTEEGYKQVLDRICSTGGSYKRHDSNNAITFINLFGCKHPIQLINMTFKETPSDIFNDFDFTVCCGLYDCQLDTFELSTDFLKHNSQRKLVYNTTNSYPIMSMIRSEKYKALGYKLSNAELLKILFKINSLNLQTNQEVLKQITGFYLNKQTRHYLSTVLNNDEPFDINTVSEVLGSFSFSSTPTKDEGYCDDSLLF